MKCPKCQCQLEYGVCNYHRDCDRCGGEGSVMTRRARTYDPDTASPEEWDECPTCQGDGWVTV